MTKKESEETTAKDISDEPLGASVAQALKGLEEAVDEYVDKVTDAANKKLQETTKHEMMQQLGLSMELERTDESVNAVWDRAELVFEDETIEYDPDEPIRALDVKTVGDLRQQAAPGKSGSIQCIHAHLVETAYGAEATLTVGD